MRLGHGNHVLERRNIAKHGIDAFQNDELARFWGQALQPLFERLNIIMLEGHDFGIAHLAAVPDGGMAVDIQDDVITLARNGRNNAEIGLITRRKHHGMIHGVKVFQRLFDQLMALIGAIEDAAAGCACAKCVQRLFARGQNIVVKGHAHIIIGAEQNRFAAIAHGDCRRFHFVHHQRKGIAHTRCEKPFALLDQRIKFRK